MRIETGPADFTAAEGPCPDSLPALAAYWAHDGALLADGALRRALAASFAATLQAFWPYGGYGFAFLRETRPSGTDLAALALLVDEMLVAARRHESPGFESWSTDEVALPGSARAHDAPALALSSWREVETATRAWLAHWLFGMNTIPASLRFELERPWQRCVAELTAGEGPTAAATLLCHRGDGGPAPPEVWDDFGYALALASPGRVHVLYVGLTTD